MHHMPEAKQVKMVCDWRPVLIYSRPGLKIVFISPLLNIKNRKIFKIHVQNHE